MPQITGKPTKPIQCIACEGVGRNSNNRPCFPCQGTGVQGGKDASFNIRKFDKQDASIKPKAKKQPKSPKQKKVKVVTVKGSLFD